VNGPGGQEGGGDHLDTLLARAAFEDSSIGMALLEARADGKDERVIRVNDALCSIVGRTREELLDSGVDLLDVADWPAAAESLRTTGTGGERGESVIPF